MEEKQDTASKISFVQGDITDQEVDAIVNAANNDLILGGGVAGAIRRKGGEEIQEECTKIGTIALGEAVVTGAGTLKAKLVIHAATMQLGGWTTEEALRNATKNALKRACEKGAKSIALPALGTGIGAFSIDRCARVMIPLVLHHMKGPTTLEKVIFVLKDETGHEAFQEVWQSFTAPPLPPESELPGKSETEPRA